MPTVQRPSRRWPLVLAAAAVLLVLWRLLAPAGTGPTGLRAGRYALAPADLAALAEDRWQATAPRIDLGLVERAAAGLVELPDDRHLAAWRAAGAGSEVTQVTLLYDDPAAARALLAGRAAGLLASHFDLAADPIDLPGADEAARWRGPAWTAVSARRGGVILFVAAVGDRAPDPAALAARVVARVAADPPATATPAPP